MLKKALLLAILLLFPAGVCLSDAPFVIGILASSQGGSGAACTLNGFTHCRTITINSAQVPATQTEFPVVIYGTFAYLATTGNSGFIQNTTTLNSQTVPADLIFTSDSGCSTKLNWEVASYTATSGAIEVWVDTPISSSSSTVIYECYGKSSVTTYQGSATSTWDSNYKSVWHLANGSSLSYNDSTSAANTGLPNTTPSAGAGLIDGGMVTNGGSGGGAEGFYATVNTVGPSPPLTASAWLYPTSSSNYMAFFGGSTASGDLEIRMDTAKTISVLKATVADLATSVGTLTLNAWNFVAVTVDSSNNIVIYINNNAPEIFSGAYSTPPHGLNSVGYSDFGDTGWVGTMDEAELSNTNRSANWIKTAYNNQNAPNTFYTIGTQN